jgi:crotonobetainyl-CoA:carnitine CoA-transferase CaiB-like acyl-CoA transferase
MALREDLMSAGTAALTGPLHGLVALEISDTPAAAFAAVLAADFGAEVIVCEPPPSGSNLRRLGTPDVQRVWWPVIARNKLSLGIDLAHPEAAPILEQMAGFADLLFRDDQPLAARSARDLVNEGRLLDVHLYPPGTDRPDLWPWSTEPEFAAAATGMMALTGDLDGPAVQPEMPLADYAAGMMALTLAMAELRASRHEDRSPRPVELALHEALHRMNEWHIVVATGLGRAEKRNGNRFPMNANIGNIFKTRDGKLLTVSAATPSVADRLLNMIGGKELRDDPRFNTPAARRANMDALDAVVAEWLLEHDMDEAMRLVRENDVVVGPISDARDLASHAHIMGRGDIARSSGDGEGALTMPSALPFVTPVGGHVRHPGPVAGADTERVMKMLGFKDEETANLRSAGVIWS